MTDISTDWLLKIAKAAYAQKTKQFEVFASKLTRKQLSLNRLEELAQGVFVSTDMVTTKPKQRLSSVDLSIFTNLLIAVICKGKGYRTENQSVCLETLNLTIFQFKSIDPTAQKRLAKCLLEAANQVRS